MNPQFHFFPSLSTQKGLKQKNDHLLPLIKSLQRPSCGLQNTAQCSPQHLQDPLYLASAHFSNPTLCSSKCHPGSLSGIQALADCCSWARNALYHFHLICPLGLSLEFCYLLEKSLTKLHQDPYPTDVFSLHPELHFPCYSLLASFTCQSLPPDWKCLEGRNYFHCSSSSSQDGARHVGGF